MNNEAGGVAACHSVWWALGIWMAGILDCRILPMKLVKSTDIIVTF